MDPQGGSWLCRSGIERRRVLDNSARVTRARTIASISVGATLLSSDGRLFTGCNVENSTYGLSMCAERVAIFKAISEGVTAIARVVVVTDHENIAPPCGSVSQRYAAH